MNPIALEEIPRTWKNTRGATVDYRSVEARFDARTIDALTGFPLTLVVATEVGESRCDDTEIPDGALRRLLNRK